jgi:hypothetical protein
MELVDRYRRNMVLAGDPLVQESSSRQCFKEFGPVGPRGFDHPIQYSLFSLTRRIDSYSSNLEC